jgi:hypothetical protein
MSALREEMEALTEASKVASMSYGGEGPGDLYWDFESLHMYMQSHGISTKGITVKPGKKVTIRGIANLKRFRAAAIKFEQKDVADFCDLALRDFKHGDDTYHW